MSQADTLVVKDIVLVGGGHSHVLVLKYFAMHPVAGVRLTVISRELQSPYSGMLPGYIAGHYSFDETHIDLLPLCRFAGARFFHDEVTGLDISNKQLICQGRPPLSYDILSIDIGSSPMAATVPGAVDNTIVVKPIDSFLVGWEQSLAAMIASDGKSHIGVVGTGAAGVELILAIKHRLDKECHYSDQDNGKFEFHLFGDGNDILPGYKPFVRAKFRRVLKERKIHFYPDHKVTGVTDKAVRCDNGVSVNLDKVFWATSATAQQWPGEAGLHVDEPGFIKVKDTLESVSHPGIFASGDIAHMIKHPRPKAGVYAVRQGPVLAQNLQRSITGRPLKRFVPQKQFLSLISTGDQYAVASRYWWALEGAYIWRWKDWIDRRFMKKFSDLPAMEDTVNGTAVLPDGGMRCGGCGGKIAAGILDGVLSQLIPETGADILIGLGQPDDAAVVSLPPDKVLVQTVDFFRSFVDDPYLFGQIAANHALNDVFAMGADPQTALAIVSLPYGTEDKLREELLQMLQGAISVLNESDTTLAGGHTGEAQELSLGFAVSGYVDPDRILRKQGMQPGDRVLITKALGTGTLFAADMRHKARGPWISEAIGSMVQSNQKAVHCFLEHGVTACTDISGFGLLGHLLEMIRASSVNAELDIDALPRLNGVAETLAEGIFSSLHSENSQVENRISNQIDVMRHANYPLLFDPQTAGGLLATVPADNEKVCLDKLRKQGFTQAAIIGEVVNQNNVEKPVCIVSKAS